MDSSSDGSFAWTDASDNSTDNGNMTKISKNKNQYGEESESEQNYKKKLQEQLFLGEGHEEASPDPIADQKSRKRTLCQYNSDADDIRSPKKRRVKAEPMGNGDGEVTSSPTADLKSRKRMLSQYSSDTDDTQSPEKRGVKAEPESDADIPRKNKSLKLKTQDLTDDVYDESFLDSKVKSEQRFAAPSPLKAKKKKKHSVLDVTDTSISNGHVAYSENQSLVEFSNSRLSSEETSTPDYSHVKEDGNNSIICKKNKNKFKNSSISIDVDNSQSSAEEDETPYNTVTKQPISSPDSEISSSSASTHDHVKPDKNRTGKKSKSSQDHTSFTESVTTAQINSDNLFTKRKTRMSERIQFEDEDDTDVQVVNSSTRTSIIPMSNSKVKSFIKDSSLNLRPHEGKPPSALILTADDDLWLIRGPKEVRPEMFQDRKWSLDSKCKIKLDGQTYEGDVGDTNSNVAILSSDGDRAVIKTVTINGCVKLRRRLPKAHTHDDSRMVNNQTNFIPLPDTKCRHPLFGLHYKKAMKLPSGVVERLSRASLAIAYAGKKRKKKDRGNPGTEELASPAALKEERNGARVGAPEQEELTDSMIAAKKKKKKKRRQSDAVEDDSAPSVKRKKRNLESAEAWESEKAIEENLFNF